MDQAVYIRRRANAQVRLDAAMQKLAARFEVPEKFSFKSTINVPSATSQVRDLLNLEALAGAAEQLVDAPVRSDAARRVGRVEEPRLIPLTTPLLETPPAARERRVVAAFGHVDNPGPPVLHAPGRVNIDANGQNLSHVPGLADEHTRAMGEAAMRFQAEVARAAQDEEPLPVAAEHDLGFEENQGPPVVTPVGATLVGAQGNRMLLNPEVAARNSVALGEAAAAHQENVHRIAQEAAEKVDTDKLPRRSGFPDNPGPGVANIHNGNVDPDDPRRLHEDDLERTKLANRYQAQISRTAQREAERALEEDEFEINDLPDAPSLRRSADAMDESIERAMADQLDRAERARVARGDATAPAKPEAMRPPHPGATAQVTPASPVQDTLPSEREAAPAGTAPSGHAENAAVDDPEIGAGGMRVGGRGGTEIVHGQEQPASARRGEPGDLRAAVEAARTENAPPSEAEGERPRAAAEEADGGEDPFEDLPITETQAAALRDAGYDSLDKLRAASDDSLKEVPGIGPATVRHIRSNL